MTATETAWVTGRATATRVGSAVAEGDAVAAAVAEAEADADSLTETAADPDGRAGTGAVSRDVLDRGQEGVDGVGGDLHVTHCVGHGRGVTRLDCARRFVAASSVASSASWNAARMAGPMSSSDDSSSAACPSAPRGLETVDRLEGGRVLRCARLGDERRVEREQLVQIGLDLDAVLEEVAGGVSNRAACGETTSTNARPRIARRGRFVCIGRQGRPGRVVTASPDTNEVRPADPV